MLKNYLKIAWRNLLKDKLNNFLNITGLAVGIATAGLIFLWAERELSVDNFHENREQIYQIREHMVFDDQTFTHSSTPGPLALVLPDEMPGVELAARKSEGNSRSLFTVNDKGVYAEGTFIDPQAFEIFSWEFQEGSAATAFQETKSIVFTKEGAEKVFGTSEGLVGKSVKVNNQDDYQVTGILKNIPKNATIQFDWLSPLDILYSSQPWMKDWTNQGTNTFVKLSENADLAALNNKLYDYLEAKTERSNMHLFFFPMNDWYLRSQFDNGVQTGGGRITNIKLFISIALIILLIACINFMNISTARSEKRAKEVGMRKVLGSEKSSLIWQFITESVTKSMLAMLIGVGMMWMVLPYFSTLIGSELSLSLLLPIHAGTLLFIGLGCGLLAGSYPALYLSSFKPIAVLKGFTSRGKSASLVRKILVVGQYAASIALIICSLIVYQQINHIKNRDLGFDKTNVIEVAFEGELVNHYDALKDDLIKSGLFSDVSLSDHKLITGGNNTSYMRWDGKPEDSQVLISTRYVDNEFLNTYKLKLTEGRDFVKTDEIGLTSEEYGNPNIIITESMAKLMGEGSPVGKAIYYDDAKLTVIGVIQDYVYGNIYGKPDPVAFFCLKPQYANLLNVKITENGDRQAALNLLTAVAQKYNPAYPFQYRYVDDQFNQMISDETFMGSLSKLFSILAVFISCLGLYGLASHMAERRTKEIGIRKVLGSSVSKVLQLLSVDFIKLIFVAALVSFPIAWYVMNDWLSSYDYRVEMHWWVFALSGILALFIALLTISYQAIKAANSNPVESLKIE